MREQHWNCIISYATIGPLPGNIDWLLFCRYSNRGELEMSFIKSFLEKLSLCDITDHIVLAFDFKPFATYSLGSINRPARYEHKKPKCVE